MCSAHMRESCLAHTHPRVMSSVRVSHVTCKNEPCHTHTHFYIVCVRVCACMWVCVTRVFSPSDACHVCIVSRIHHNTCSSSRHHMHMYQTHAHDALQTSTSHSYQRHSYQRVKSHTWRCHALQVDAQSMAQTKRTATHPATQTSARTTAHTHTSMSHVTRTDEPHDALKCVTNYRWCAGYRKHATNKTHCNTHLNTHYMRETCRTHSNESCLA